MMKTVVLATCMFTHLALALRPAVHFSRQQQQQQQHLHRGSSSSKLFSYRNTMINSLRKRRNLLCMQAGDESIDGPFTRKSLLEGVSKAAGVVGAGAFVQKGLIAGVPYNSRPDLTGKARIVSIRCQITSNQSC